MNKTEMKYKRLSPAEIISGIDDLIKDRQSFLSNDEQENKAFLEDINLLKNVKANLYNLAMENKKLAEYCCKRNECSGRIKENHKLTGYEIIEELEKWLNEQWEKPAHKIYVSDVVTKIRELKGDE